MVSDRLTAHPTAAWTLQQLREVIGLQERCEYLLHDRDSIFASHLDESMAKLGVKVLKSPVRSPTANSICERVIGTMRRECLDWLIPLTESHLRSILKLWIAHYNTGGAHIWRWVLVYPIRRSANSTIPIQMRIIAALTRMPSVPVRFWVDCITNTSSRPTVHN
jgi:transposase InsO family protein